MAGGIATAHANALLDHDLGGGDYTREATVYAGLLTVLPQSDGSSYTEASGGGYGRQSITNNATNFPAASAGQKSNGTAIVWGTFSAALGTILGIGIFDASTGGNLKRWATLGSSIYVDSGEDFAVPVGGLTFTLQTQGA
jgi:hypothetical protein